MLALAACLWLGALALPAVPVEPASYVRFELFELAAHADLAVAGEIVALHGDTFELAVETTVLGDPAPDRLRVTRFQDWTCAGRWTRYGVGQRVLLFLVRLAEGDGPLHILGAGGEGELPLLGESIVVRDRVHGYLHEKHAVLGGTCDGAAVPLAELAEALRGFRSAFAWQVGRRMSITSLDFRSEPNAVRLRDSSRAGRHLWEQVVSSAEWQHPLEEPPFPASGMRLEALACGLSGPARIAPGRPGARLDTDLGAACAYLGDVDGNGVEDLAVGAPYDSYLGQNDGALWILLLEREGKLLRAVEISKGTSALPRIADFQCFGRAVAPLGDLDRDGVPDVAVGAAWGNDAARASGGVWVLFLDRAGGVKRSVELGAGEALRAAGVGAGSTIGTSLACLGDVDGDGFPELAMSQVPSSKDDIFSVWREGLSVLIASLDQDGGVRWTRAFNERSEGFTAHGSSFGSALAGLGDVNGDGVPDLAVGNPSDDDGGSSRGAVWIVTLATDGSPQRSQKISDWEGGFEGVLRDGEQLGRALSAPRDLDGNGVPDLVACGATGVWALFLNSDCTVKRHKGWTVHPPDFGLKRAGVSAACGSPTAGGSRSVPLALGGKIQGNGTAEDGAVWLLRLAQDGSLSSQ